MNSPKSFFKAEEMNSGELLSHSVKLSFLEEGLLKFTVFSACHQFSMSLAKVIEGRFKLFGIFNSSKISYNEFTFLSSAERVTIAILMYWPKVEGSISFIKWSVTFPETKQDSFTWKSFPSLSIQMRIFSIE